MKKNIFIYLFLFSILFLGGCTKLSYTNDYLNDGKTGENVINQNIVSNENINKDIHINNNPGLETELRNNLAQEVSKFCEKHNDMSDGIKNGLNEYKNLISIYEKIVENKDTNSINAFYADMDNIIGQNCYLRWDMLNMEMLAEQIRRNDFTTIEQKEEITTIYMDKYYNPLYNDLLEKVKNKFYSKDEFINKTTDFINSKENPLYLIFSQRYNWNKIQDSGSWFKPQILERNVVNILEEGFNNLIKEYGLTKTDYEKEIYKKLSVKDLDGLIKITEDKFEILALEYNLKNYFNFDNEFTKEERKEFVENEIGFNNKFEKLINDENFINKTKEIRLYIYYIIYFGKEQGMDSSKTRVTNFKNGGGIQNLFRMSRNIEEPFTVSLNMPG